MFFLSDVDEKLKMQVYRPIAVAKVISILSNSSDVILNMSFHFRRSKT